MRLWTGPFTSQPQPPSLTHIPTESILRDASDAGGFIGRWGRTLHPELDADPFITQLCERTLSTGPAPLAAAISAGNISSNRAAQGLNAEQDAGWQGWERWGAGGVSVGFLAFRGVNVGHGTSLGHLSSWKLTRPPPTAESGSGVGQVPSEVRFQVLATTPLPSRLGGDQGIDRPRFLCFSVWDARWYKERSVIFF